MISLKTLIFSWVLIIPPFLAKAGQESVGTTSANFLKIPPEARPAAMGEAYSAISDDEAALVYNPSGIARALQTEISATHIEWFQALHLEHFGGIMPMGVLGVGGASLTWLQVDDMTRTERDNPGAADALDRFREIGTFSPHDFSLNLAYAKPFNPNINMGGELKIVGQSIDTSSGYGVALDVGAQYVEAVQNLDFGAGIRNLGSPIKMGDTAFSMPLTFYGGAVYGLWNRRINLVGEVLMPTDNAMETSLGIEGWVLDMLALRAGYKTGYLSQPTAGMGARLGDLRMDYAWVPYDELGTTHRLTVSFTFGMPSLGLTANPGLFAPNGDEKFRLTHFIAELTAREKVRSWTLTIQNKHGERVRTLRGEGPVPAGIAWDGKDESGRVLPDLVFTGKLEANYGNGLKAQSTGADVELDSTPPDISLDVDPKLLRPNSAGAILIPAQYKLKAQDLHGVGGWKLTIKDEQGNVFRVFSGDGQPPESIVWDGTNGQGTVANSGKIFTAVPWAKDSLGNAAEGRPVAEKVLFREIKLTLAADTLFDPGKADVKIANYQELKMVADLMKQHGGNHVEIYGHTDNVPVGEGSEYHDNLRLSQARAQAVITFLVTFFRVDPAQVKAVGRGETEPVQTNETAEGRQANRRVEVIIHTKELQ